MNLKVGIKKVSTTTKDGGIDAQVVFEFIVSPQALNFLMELLELQRQSVFLSVMPEQQNIFRKDEFESDLTTANVMK